MRHENLQSGDPSRVGADEWHVSILAQHIQTIFDNRTNLLTFPQSGENLHRLLQTMVVERQIVSGFDIERILAGSDWNREDRYRVIFLKLLVSPGVDINATYLCSKIERLWKGSCTLQAEALFIHRTTLISRLKKIQKLYSVDLEDPQTVHHLMLSFALLGVES